MSVQLINARIFDKGSPYHDTLCSLLIENGVVKKIGEPDSAIYSIDVKGNYLIKGLTELSCTVGDPGFEHTETLESIQQVGLYGGFSRVFVLPNSFPVRDKKSAIEYVKSKSNGSLLTIESVGAISVGAEGKDITEMIDLSSSGVKIFSDGIHSIQNSELLLKALQYTKKFDGIVVNRPSDAYLSKNTHMHEGIVSTTVGLKGEPSISEELVIARDVSLLKYSSGRLHLSGISSKNSLQLIEEAKKEGLKLTCDVALPNLLYSDESLRSFDSNFKVKPPLRTEEDRKALIQGVSKGVIDAIITDHRPLDIESKKLEFDLADPGMISMQTAMSSLFEINDELSFEESIKAFPQGPAIVLGESYSPIEAGCAANFSVFDPELSWTLDAKSNKSLSENSPLFGNTIKGKCTAVVKNGVYSELV